jgi:protein-tyrosine phosphatase
VALLVFLSLELGIEPDFCTKMTDPYKLLFVCMGNICRSPAAEGIMSKMIIDLGLESQVHIDSAGTGGWHSGARADHRMRAAATARGYDLTSVARQVKETDLVEFDLILVMDQQNHRDLRAFDPDHMHDSKVHFLCEYCSQYDSQEVPDPYYGGEQGFENVLNLLEDGCAGLLKHVKTALVARQV